ncbi:MAG: RsbRD N-terminal domain-containing protein [Acidobacteria bacterium]|nr:RsbRD N-terminal domain-containing protein [Acidobacteriota bacterium]
MPEEISLLLQNGADSIVREWTNKVATDRRVSSDAHLTYLQLVDHVPQILEDVRRALLHEPETIHPAMAQQHGRLRWKQGYELKEVVRELMLLRTTLMEFIEQYRGALQHKKADHLMQAYRRLNGFMDEELYRTIEAYLESAEQVTV